jgi:hypothetical protein
VDDSADISEVQLLGAVLKVCEAVSESKELCDLAYAAC